jgi:acyl-coenzyme A thioesterase PaaI-like protein
MENRTPINQEMLAGNACFGCSLTNPQGLQIRIYRDGARRDRLIGEYSPRDGQQSLPGIVHGGIQFTALDCMAGWIVFGLRCDERKMPVTLNTQIRYRKPAKLHQFFTLSAEVTSTEITGEGPKQKEIITIHTEARDSQNDVISEADFKYMAMPEKQFCQVVGIEELSEAYRKHFASVPKSDG